MCSTGQRSRQAVKTTGLPGCGRITTRTTTARSCSTPMGTTSRLAVTLLGRDRSALHDDGAVRGRRLARKAFADSRALGPSPGGDQREVLERTPRDAPAADSPPSHVE